MIGEESRWFKRKSTRNKKPVTRDNSNNNNNNIIIIIIIIIIGPYWALHTYFGKC